MANSKDKGDLSEAMALAAFLRAGLTVLQPFGDNKRYDLVIERSGEFYRVQSKTARLIKERGALLFATCSSYTHRGHKKRGYHGEIEFFAVYSPDLDKVYLVPVDDVPTREGALRLEETKNKQTKNVRWARDYEFTGDFPR